MRQLRSSLGIALLMATGLVVQTEPSLAATEPGGVQAIAPPAINTRNSAVYLPSAPVPSPATDAPKPAASDPPAARAPAGAKAGEVAKPGDEPVEVLKLKHQIKATRLSLADTQGRLAVTEKDLASASGENTQLRSDTTNLRVGLAKAETVAKKSEDELGHRRREVQTLQSARYSGYGMLVVVLLLGLLTVAMLAAVLFRHGSKLRAILDRVQNVKADDRRVEQVRTELKAELKEEQERARRLEEELQRVRAAAESQASQASQVSQVTQAPPPVGSKREKLEHVRRELRQAQTAIEAEKRRADERVSALEADLARLRAERQELDERVQKLEPEMAQLAAAKQNLVAQVQRLEPEVERLNSERLEAEGRGRLLAHDVARLTAEKLRLEHTLAKANEKLAFFGQDEPEDTLPPIVG